MASRFEAGETPSLAIKFSNGQITKAAEQPLYRPGEIVTGFIEVHAQRPFEVISLHGSFIGQTRVWTHPGNREDLIKTNIHTHLNQSYDFSSGMSSRNISGRGETIDLPVALALPEVVEGILYDIPPSCEIGTEYIDPQGRKYMQPLIEYSLQFSLRYRLPTETSSRWTSIKRKIGITATVRNDPPAYSQCPLEATMAASAAGVRRSRLSKAFARLSLLMAEPGPIVGHVSGSCQTVAQLQMTWSTTADAFQRPEMEKTRVKIEYHLEAKTRFGSDVILSRDGASSSEARSHNRTAARRLGGLEIRLADLKNVQIAKSEELRTFHTGTIPIPVLIDEGTVPTFSHLLAGRSYALLVKIKVQGLQHDHLSLKVPLQICESVTPQKMDEVGVRPCVIGTSLSTEFLPRYTSHSNNPLRPPV